MCERASSLLCRSLSLAAEVGDSALPRAEDLDSAIQVVLEPRSQSEAEMVDGRPVIPLQETVAFANEYYATLESALDMFGRMYDDVDTNATYCAN